MKKNVFVLLILAIFVISISAEGKERKSSAILSGAIKCLLEKKALPESNDPFLTVGYQVDGKSYPGQKLIYLISYSKNSTTPNSIYTVFYIEKREKFSFDIQNNASFIYSKNGLDGVEFTNPPLGGSWTQLHIANAINQIARRTKFSISMSDLAHAKQSFKCSSYTDG